MFHSAKFIKIIQACYVDIVNEPHVTRKKKYQQQNIEKNLNLLPDSRISSRTYGKYHYVILLFTF